MITRALAALTLIAALAVTAPDPAQGAPLSATRQAEIITEVKAVTTAMWDAFERLDADAAMKDFPVGPATLVVDSDGSIADPDAFREGLRAFYTSISRMHFATIREEYRVLAPDAVLYVRSYLSPKPDSPRSRGPR